MGLLIDSTLFIEAERSRETAATLLEHLLERFGDVGVVISVVSAGELLHGVWRADSPARRARREEFVESILAAVPVVPVTLPVLRLHAELDARLRASGESLPASDLLIASTALSRGDAVVTGTPRHFARVADLVVHTHPETVPKPRRRR